MRGNEVSKGRVGEPDDISDEQMDDDFDVSSKPHVRGAPVLDVYSVELKPNDESLLVDNKPWEVYGEIKVTNGCGFTSDLYQHLKNDPEEIEVYYVQKQLANRSVAITLINTEAVLHPLPETSFEVRLWDRVRGIEVANGRFSLNFADCNDFEEKSGVYVVEGKDGSAIIRYHFYPCAVYGYVEIQPVQKLANSDGLDDVFDVYGSVYALCGDDRGGSYRVELFDETKEYPVKVNSYDRLGLQHNFIVVPAYSALKLEVKLWDNDICQATFPPQDFGFNCRTIAISDIHRFRASVVWFPAYLEDTISELNRLQQEVYSQETKKQRPNKEILLSNEHTSFAFGPALEMFSAYFVRNDDQPFHLCGSIEVDHGDGTFLFKRELSDAMPLIKKSQSLEILGPSSCCFECIKLEVKVSLMDDQNQHVCKGFMLLSEHELANSRSISWYDRRVCSVIGGERGYIALHYSVFSRAVQAIVSVTLNDSSCIPFKNVRGKILARYSNYFYETPSEAERYTSVLFSEVTDRRLEFTETMRLPLAKSAVPVPKDSSLFIDFNLSVNSGSAELKGITHFAIGTSLPWKISGRGCDANVFVEWRSCY